MRADNWTACPRWSRRREELLLAIDALDYLFSDELSLNDPPYSRESGDGWSSGWEEAIEHIRDEVTFILLGGCRECRQVNGHHKLDCGRRS